MTSYVGRYVPGVQHGGERAEIACVTASVDGGTSRVVLASGPRAVLDWETTADKAGVAVVVLRHWLQRQPDADEMHDFLDALASDLISGQAWEISGAQLIAAGFTP